MLAVLMSMKPEWWEKILDGEKTLEIRKTHPQTNFMPYLEKLSCVPLADLKEYAGGKCLSGWIVRSPEKFDVPSPLAEFGLDRPPMSWQYVEIPDEMEAEHE